MQTRKLQTLRDKYIKKLNKTKRCTKREEEIKKKSFIFYISLDNLKIKFAIDTEDYLELKHRKYLLCRYF